MSNFRLKHEGFSSATSIPNSFIEKYMPTAAGEFVKIYIYLLKCINENCCELSIPLLADVFNNTEKDTIRALKYWEKRGLVRLTFDENNELKSLVLTSSETEEPVQETIITRALPNEGEIPFSEKKQYSRAEVDSFCGQDENRMLNYSIQKFLGRVLTSNDINTIMFFEESLGFDKELIEYVFEYCANNKKTNIRYIEKTGINWANQGIKDVKGAKLINSIYSENCYPVMKALGLTGRYPAKEESAFIDRWVLSYGFNLDMILEACSRTINTIHQPSFEYVDSILKNWKAKGISTIEDAKKSDAEHAKKSAAKKAPEKKEAKPTAFNDFHQRTYDYDELEEKLINR